MGGKIKEIGFGPDYYDEINKTLFNSHGSCFDTTTKGSEESRERVFSHSIPVAPSSDPPLSPQTKDFHKHPSRWIPKRKEDIKPNLKEWKKIYFVARNLIEEELGKK